MYRSTGAALLRAAAHPDGLDVPACPPEPLTSPQDASAWLDWVRRTWAVPFVAQAVSQASPALADRIAKLCRAAGAASPKQVRSAATSLYRYVLRIRHRATPFGLFAGIAPLLFGPKVAVQWGQQHRPTENPDATWLHQTLARLENRPGLLRELTVVLDPAATIRNARLVLPCTTNEDETRAPGELSARLTRALHTVATTASTPVRFADLAQILADDHPGTSARDIESYLTELISQGFLRPSLQPAMTCPRPLDHLKADLTQIGTDTAEVTPPMQTVDLRLDCAIALPDHVAHEAATAAGILARLTPHPSGTAAWRDYHARFLREYGTGTSVPLNTLLDPVRGLGYPAGFRGSVLPEPAPATGPRDQRLLALAQRAALDHCNEIELTDQTLAELTLEPTDRPRPHVDLRFQLHAACREDTDRGAYRITVTGLTRAGATTGRFLHLLEPGDRDRLTRTYASLPPLETDADRIQVSVPPLLTRTENVARAPAILPTVVHLGEHPDRPDAVPLHDLAVVADEDRLQLIRLSTHRPVEPAMFNAVDLAAFTHPLARFLIELPAALTGRFGLFDWGAARSLPFLPRLRYGRIILTPAAWRLTPADVGGIHPEGWPGRMNAWRSHRRVPAHIETGNGDRWIRLDLEQPADADLLRDRLTRSGETVLREAPAIDAYGWLDGRAHEITLTLTADPPGQPRNEPAPLVLAQPADTVFPGSGIYADLLLYGDPDLGELAEIVGAGTVWWFEPEPSEQACLRVGLRLATPAEFGPLTTRIGRWAASQQQRGILRRLTWDTHRRRPGTYGDGPLLDAVEEIHAADSAAVIAQQALSAHLPPPVVTAAGAVDLATSFSGIEPGMHWLTGHLRTDTSSPLPRDLHRAASDLADPCDARNYLIRTPGGSNVLAAWDRRRHRVETYRRRLDRSRRADPDRALTALLNAQLDRASLALQVDPALARRLTRAVALTWTARTKEASA